MNPELAFSDTYANARLKFLDAAERAGASLRKYTHPSQRGPGGEALSTDVAHLGPTRARTVVLVSSGTHGVEGFCGSGCQLALLDSALRRELPRDTALVLVHALNPFGFAHLRRVNEDNVDPNRNFVDYASLKFNAAYDSLHKWLVPTDWDGPGRREADAAIATFIRDKGIRAFQTAATTGQYDHPDGLFFGGRKAIWSNTVWRDLLRREPATAAHSIAIDVHTGLGPSGVGEVIYMGAEDDPSHLRARALFGNDVTSSNAGTSTSAPIGGVLADGAAAELGADRVTMIALEYGTHSLDRVLAALRADNWLYVHGCVESKLGRDIRGETQDAFYVDTAAWKRDVVDRCLSLISRTYREIPRVLG